MNDTNIIVYVPGKWNVQLAGPSGLIIYQITNPPNKFHRFMQKLILGFIWTKDE